MAPQQNNKIDRLCSEWALPSLILDVDYEAFRAPGKSKQLIRQPFQPPVEESEDESFAKLTCNTMGFSASNPSEGPPVNPLDVFDHCEVHTITPRKLMQSPIPLSSGTVNSFLGRERKPSGRGPVMY
jgi:hypothetical protein